MPTELHSPRGESHLEVARGTIELLVKQTSNKPLRDDTGPSFLVSKVAIQAIKSILLGNEVPYWQIIVKLPHNFT